MAFWGVYLKPTEPYTLHYDVAPKRIRMTRATLGDATRYSPARSIVRCSIGDKPPIAICSLSVKEFTCCQLELEFEESHDVVFSVIGPRGVYLAGYLMASAQPTHQLPIFGFSGHMVQVKETLAIVGSSDHALPQVEFDSSKPGLVNECVDAQNTDIEHSDKQMKGGKRLLKCINREGKVTITVDCKKGKDGNEYPTGDENQEKAIAVKTHLRYGGLVEEKSDAIEKKKKKKKKNRKRKRSASETTASEHVNGLQDEKPCSDSRITEENGHGSSLDASERNHDKVKERKKKSKRVKDLVNA